MGFIACDMSFKIIMGLFFSPFGCLNVAAGFLPPLFFAKSQV